MGQTRRVKHAIESLPRIIEARFVRACGEPDQFPPPAGLEVVFAGRSNAGKSSLMNALMGRTHLVRTSSTPGCTRRIGFYEARTKAEVITLVDLPGYGYTERSKSERRRWSTLIESYLLERPTLRAMLLVVDVRRGLEQEERELLELMATERSSRLKVSSLIVATKLDKVPSSARKITLARLRPSTPLPVLGCSIRMPDTIGELWARLGSAVGLTDGARGAAPRTK